MRSSSNHLIEIFKQLTESSCPVNYNFHCHTIYSDGSLSPVELITQATQLRLKHLAITDHHTIDAYSIASNWLSSNSNKMFLPKLWSGIEISCILNKCLVHILGYNINIKSSYLYPYVNNEAPIGHYLQADNVIKAIHESGGLSILAHPARYRLDYKVLIDSAYALGIDGVEVWYDYEMSDNWKPSNYVCQSISDYANKYNLLKTCGTDTHGLSLMRR